MTQENPHGFAPIDVPLVRHLIADQFPKWAHLPITPVNTPGHDSRTFRLASNMSLRIPSAHRYGQHVETERLWLSRLVPHLPLPIPMPMAIGKPACDVTIAWTCFSGESRRSFSGACRLMMQPGRGDVVGALAGVAGTPGVPANQTP